MVEADDGEPARVGVVVADTIDDEAMRLLKTVRGQRVPRTVLVVSRLDDGQLVNVVEVGVVGVVRRAEATSDRLVSVISAADSGDGTLPPDLLGRLLDQVGRLQRHVLEPRGLTFAGLAPREVEALRLVAEGHDTVEIARRMSYSERTVKKVLQDLMTRLQVRNRAQAVAYAMRHGLI